MDNNAYNEKELFPPILAVDFDGTLVSNEFPNIGKPDWVTVNMVKEQQKKGWKLILWSCRTGEALQQAADFCRNTLGLDFDAVNDNIPEVQQYFGESTRKVFANLYLDDRNAAFIIRKDKPDTIGPMPLFVAEEEAIDIGVDYGA